MSKTTTACFYCTNGTYKKWKYTKNVSLKEAREWVKNEAFIFVGEDMYHFGSSYTRMRNVFTGGR